MFCTENCQFEESPETVNPWDEAIAAEFTDPPAIFEVTAPPKSVSFATCRTNSVAAGPCHTAVSFWTAAGSVPPPDPSTTGETSWLARFHAFSAVDCAFDELPVPRLLV